MTLFMRTASAIQRTATRDFPSPSSTSPSTKNRLGISWKTRTSVTLTESILLAQGRTKELQDLPSTGRVDTWGPWLALERKPMMWKYSSSQKITLGPMLL